MPTGTVKFFNENKGYGFIQPDGGGNDAFVHITAVERAGMRTLRENQRVGYDLEPDRRGKMAACNLREAGDEGGTEAAEAAEPAGQAADSQPSGEDDQAANEQGSDAAGDAGGAEPADEA